VPLVLERNPDARFVIAGSIGSDFFLEELAEKLGVSSYISFPGRISNEERTQYYSTARVLAQPSEYEGFGLAQLEAMSYGLPVVTSPKAPCRKWSEPAAYTATRMIPRTSRDASSPCWVTEASGTLSADLGGREPLRTLATNAEDMKSVGLSTSTEARRLSGFQDKAKVGTGISK